ncbi:tetratricopeptide repeat protein [Roseomonas sp. CAU 1739]|uniref:tetratricopeptide repeat protein n=1 Tax=Roseomonas sp. CAU 1739 TaxID=3140364 RepID=UPI00325BF4A7
MTATQRVLAALAMLGGVVLCFAIAAILSGQGAGFRIAAPVQAHQRAAEGFVGSATCATCHAPQAAAWQDSDHARAMAAATPQTVLGDFSGVTVTDRDRSATFRRDGDRFIVRTDGPGGVTTDVTVTETFGVDPLQQYLVLFPDGRRQALPWAWDTRPREAGGQRWYHLLPNESLHAGDPLHWTGRDQNWNFMCAACHSTGVQRGYDAATDRYDTTWTEISVGCESCHGRGAAHVAWAQADPRPEAPLLGLEVALRDASGGAWRFSEADPRGIAHWEGPPRQAEAQAEICAPCHARARPITADPLPGARFLDTHAPALLDRGLYHADGQIDGEVFEWGSFAQSRMQRAGVVCADCHDPHSQRLRAEGNAVCAQCHLPARFDTADHHHHPQGSAGAQCASCHMPQVTYMGVDGRRDHGFRVPRPDIATTIGAPDACTTCHVGRQPAWAAQQIRGWFGPTRRQTPHPALAIAAGRRGDPGAVPALAALAQNQAEPAILRATALTLLPAPAGNDAAQAIVLSLRDPDPLVRAAALRALAGIDPRNRQHALSLLADPTRLVRIEAARILAPIPPQAIPEASRADFARAWDELLASERVAAERPESHVNLAGLFAARGDAAAAEAAYRDALRLDPGFLPALVNMADFENRRRRFDAAEALLNRGIAAHPDSAEAYHALGLTRVRAGRAPDSLGPLGRAAALAPDRPRYAYVYAIALNDLGRGPEAMETLRAALLRHPGQRDLLVALASLERDRGNITEAERLAAQAVQANPQDREAAALLQQLRQLRRQVPGLR